MPQLAPKTLPAGKLDVVEFGRQLVTTGDLDPVYVVLHNAGLSKTELYKWLIPYWCFYHVGTACHIADHPYYWPTMAKAAASKDYPRSSERRHFRGAFAIKAVEKLAKVGWLRPIEQLIEGSPLTLSTVMKRVKTWYGFGDWIAFKVADMLERLDICKVTFTEADTFLFDSPREGATLVVEHNATHKVDDHPKWAMDYLSIHLGTLDAPPRKERKLNGQEYETILCKWKSHLSGHYTVGKDIHEVREGLLRFSKCRTSQALLAGGKKGGLWK